jgi:hypothetical protein
VSISRGEVIMKKDHIIQFSDGTYLRQLSEKLFDNTNNEMAATRFIQVVAETNFQLVKSVFAGQGIHPTAIIKVRPNVAIGAIKVAVKELEEWSDNHLTSRRGQEVSLREINERKSIKRISDMLKDTIEGERTDEDA